MAEEDKKRKRAERFGLSVDEAKSTLVDSRDEHQDKRARVDLQQERHDRPRHHRSQDIQHRTPQTRLENSFVRSFQVRSWDGLPIEKTECFRITAEKRLEKFDVTHEDLRLVPNDDPDRMWKSGYCPEEKIKRLWSEKGRMDPVFDSGRSQAYYKVRDTLYPLDRKGSSRFWNRAGDKLVQLVDTANLLSNLSSTTFIDVCGGPGAFTQLVLRLGNKPCHGYGITLNLADTPSSDTWYPMLKNHPHFTITFGVAGSESICDKQKTWRRFF